MGGIQRDIFCHQGREEHDEGAVLGTCAIQQCLAPSGHFFAAAQRRFEVGVAGPSRLIVHLMQGLGYGVEAVAGLEKVAECPVRCVEGLMVGR